MKFQRSLLQRFSAIVGLFAIATAFTVASPVSQPPAIPGMTFNLKITLKHTPTTGRGPRAQTLLGHGQFGGGMGRIDIDTATPGPFRKGDFIIIRDTMNSFWARPSNRSVRRMSGPMVNPLEGISERFSTGTGTPSRLQVALDTISLNETLNGVSVRHFRITAEAVYPVGTQQVQQKVVIEQWLARIPIRIVNPFGSRVRGLPEAPTATGYYREFLNTLAKANRVFGEAVSVKTVTTTSYTYAPGMGEDWTQTVELLDLKQGDIDEKLFQLSGEYTPGGRADSVRKPPVAPVKKPPTR